MKERRHTRYLTRVEVGPRAVKEVRPALSRAARPIAARDPSPKGERTSHDSGVIRVGHVLFRFALLFRRPVRLHSCSLLFSLSDAECALLPGWCWSNGRSHCGQRILGRASSALRWSLKSFDSSGKFVSLRNQKSDDGFCRHREDRNTVAQSEAHRSQPRRQPPHQPGS